MLRRWLSLLTLVALGCPTITATTPGASTVPQHRTASNQTGSAGAGTGTLRGKVIAADTRQPIVGAAVTARAQGGPPTTTSTDANGRFEFGSLAAGSYSLTATKAAFLDGRAGADDAQAPGTRVECAAGQSITAPDIKLWPGGVITGTVTDASGDPAVACVVTPLRARYLLDARRLVPAGASVTTDDTGQFRLFGLAPASYYLVATPRSKPTVPGAGPVMVPVATYYPGGAVPANAQAIQVAAGSTVPVAVSLATLPDNRVVGVVLGQDGARIRAGTISIVPADGGLARTATIPATGEFEVRSLAPGTYTVENSRQTPGFRTSTELSRATVSVGDTDLTEVTLQPVQAVNVAGRITGKPGELQALKPSDVFVALASIDVMTAAPPQALAHVNDDLSFSLRGWPGAALLTASVTAPGWAVKGVRLNGRDVTDGFECESGQDISGIDIEVTNRVASVSGVVVERGGKPVEMGAVLIFPEDYAQKPRSLAVRLVALDSSGQFAGPLLLPGTYYAVAFARVPSDEWMSHGFLDRVQPLAARFSVGEGDTATLHLTRSDSTW